MVGFSSRQTAKQRVAQPQNQLGVGDLASYGLRADGLLFKKGVKSSDSNGSRFITAKKQAFSGFREGDVIGCGLDLLKKTVFFTMNGSFLGEAFKEVDLGLKQDSRNSGGVGKASRLIAAIDDCKSSNGRPRPKSLNKRKHHVSSDTSSVSQNSCNLYAAVCLQVQGDEVKCNFGTSRRKPFSFDLESHVDQLRFEEQFSKIRCKPV